MNGIEYVYSYLTPEIRGAIDSLVKFTSEPPFEVHIVMGSGSSVRFCNKRAYLGVKVSSRDMEIMLSNLTGGALYAHVDTLREGFITLDGGIRVGVCGQARYEEKRLAGVCNVTSFLIRIPRDECSFTGELFDAFSDSERGMLIFAPPSGGKTTALRALVRRLAENRVGRISLIDERCEIDSGDFDRLDVDVFKGYRRSDGMQIALRAMSPEILAVDELGVTEECVEMLDSLMSGVRFIATVHGKSYGEILKRKNLSRFFELEIFDVFAGIFNTDVGFRCEIYKNGG